MTSYSMLTVSSLGRQSLLLQADDEYCMDSDHLLGLDSWHATGHHLAQSHLPHTPLAIPYSTTPPLLMSADEDSLSSSSTSPATPSYSFGPHLSGLPIDTSSNLLNYYYSPPNAPVGLGIDFSDSPTHYQESLADFCLGGEKPKFTDDQLLTLSDSPVSAIISTPLDSFCDPKSLELPLEMDISEDDTVSMAPVLETFNSIPVVEKRAIASETDLDIPTLKTDIPTPKRRRSNGHKRERKRSMETTDIKPKSRKRKPELKLDLSGIDKVEVTQEAEPVKVSTTPPKKRRKLSTPTVESLPVQSPIVSVPPPSPPPASPMESDATIEEDITSPTPFEDVKESSLSPDEHSRECSESEEKHSHTSASSSESTCSSPLSSPPMNVSLPVTLYRRGRKPTNNDDENKPFICEDCNRTFRRQEHLKRHHRSLHTKEKPFGCDDCGKRFARSDNLAQHVRIHARHSNGNFASGDGYSNSCDDEESTEVESETEKPPKRKARKERKKVL